MKNKIVLIGAGSIVFSVSMIKDICLTKKLWGSEVCLVDINEERLENAYNLCTRYAKEVGAELLITKSLDRLEALKGATFVVNTALVGGHKNMNDGIRVAKEFGYHYGGSLHIMHDEGFWVNFYQFKLIEEVYLDAKRICPDSWHILLSNPVVAATTMMLRKYRDPKFVALCEGPNAVFRLFKQLGYDEKDVTYELSGINHYIWMTKLNYKGEDGFKLLDKWIEENGNNPEKTVGELCPKVLDMYKTFGALPIGDTYIAGGGSNCWWYHSDAQTQKEFNEDPEKAWADYFADCEKKLKDIETYVKDDSVRMTDIFGKEHSEEVIIDLIESLACDVERKIVVNVINERNEVPGLPLDFNVEVQAICNKNGIAPIATSHLPRAILGHILADRVGPVEVELEATRLRDEELLVDLVMMDHQTKDRKTARAFVDAILNLPWNSQMKEHYRGEGSKRYKKN